MCLPVLQVKIEKHLCVDPGFQGLGLCDEIYPAIRRFAHSHSCCLLGTLGVYTYVHRALLRIVGRAPVPGSLSCSYGSAKCLHVAICPTARACDLLVFLWLPMPVFGLSTCLQELGVKFL